MMTQYTTNLTFSLPDFDSTPWHDLVNNNFRQIDALMFSLFGLSDIKGGWTNSTAVVVGERYFDAVDATYYEVLVNHTTAASPTTFAADRTTNPTYWKELDAGAAISAASDAADAQTAAEAAQAAAETAQTGAETAQTGAATSASSAATSASSAATSATNAATSASTASTQATAAAASATAASTSETNAAASETATAADAVSTAADVVTAESHKDAAAASASAAATSATSATTQASTATTQASNAATSASNAAASETAAASSASAAADSATAAAASVASVDPVALNAAIAAAQADIDTITASAQAAYDTFVEVGAKFDALDTDIAGKAAASHTHNADDINAGTLADARLPSRLGTVGTTIENMNVATTNGFFYAGNTATNTPQAGAWYYGWVFSDGGDWNLQTAIRIDNGTRWSRTRASGTWGSWVQMTGADGAPLAPTTYGALTTYVWAQNNSGGTITAGNTVAGSSLTPTQSGTWRLMGVNVANAATALFARIS